MKVMTYTTVTGFAAGLGQTVTPKPDVGIQEAVKFIEVSDELTKLV